MRIILGCLELEFRRLRRRLPRPETEEEKAEEGQTEKSGRFGFGHGRKFVEVKSRWHKTFFSSLMVEAQTPIGSITVDICGNAKEV